MKVGSRVVARERDPGAAETSSRHAYHGRWDASSGDGKASMGVQTAVPVALLIEVGVVLRGKGYRGRFRGLVRSGHGGMSIDIGGGACIYGTHPNDTGTFEIRGT